MGMDAPLLSRTLGGRFKITGHIGEGAMASVFRGVDLKEGGAEIAVKVMHPHLASDRTFTARFKREAQAASMVKHPNTVTIVDIGEEQGTHYIIMELCRGRDLRTTLQAEQRLPGPRAAKIIMTICDALSAAHALGVVHRDLKPENVMIEHDPVSGVDRVKVLDFGIAKLVDAQPKVRVSGTDSDPPPALTQMGVVVGTPQYMSPEQCRGQPLDGRSDLYTCGVLLYQLVTGQLPFNSESPFEVAGKQAFEPPPPPSTHLPSIDVELEGIILRTLSKPPADRPQSAGELKGVLEQWIVKRGSDAPAGSPAGPNRGLGMTAPLSPSTIAEARAAAERPAPPRRDLPPPRPAAGAPAQASGPFKAAASAGSQPIQFDNPPTFDPHGPMGTVVAMDAVVAPPPPRPQAPEAARMTPSRPQGAPPAVQPPLDLPPLEPPRNGVAAEAPHTPARPAEVPLDIAAPPPAAPPGLAPAPAQAAAVAEQPVEGWGWFGAVMILLSVAAGVGLGFALYTLQLF